MTALPRPPKNALSARLFGAANDNPGRRRAAKPLTPAVRRNLVITAVAIAMSLLAIAGTLLLRMQ